MLNYLKKIFGIADIKVYELPNWDKPNLAIPTRSDKGVGFSFPIRSGKSVVNSFDFDDTNSKGQNEK